LGYKHLFFDLDHTIWDFKRSSEEAIHEVYEKFHIGTLGKVSYEEFMNAYRRINGNLWRAYNQGEINKDGLRERRFKQVLQHLGLEEVFEFQLMETHYMSSCPKKPHLVEGALELLRYLDWRGYELHIITNGFEETTHQKLESSGISRFFKTKSTSDGLKATKPHRAFFEKALSMARSEIQESLVIGDNLDTDILGAQEMGIDHVFYNPDQHKHGKEVMMEIQHLDELRDILK
jgi:putative hydrolase of the HAD superfamily